MFFKTVIAMLHNQKLNRWHPILFENTFAPGDGEVSAYKSRMHHTSGFATREEAVNDIPNLKERVNSHIGPVDKIAIDKDIEWDGEGIPAMVDFF